MKMNVEKAKADLKELSDEQLSDIISLIVAECKHRGLISVETTLIERTMSILNPKIDEEKRKAEEAKKQAEQTKKNWEKKKEQSLALEEVLNKEDLYITIWASDNDGNLDKRIYIKTGDFFNGKEVLCYYHHGNNKKAPGSIATNLDLTSWGVDMEKLKQLLKLIAESWRPTKFNTQYAISYNPQ